MKPWSRSTSTVGCDWHEVEEGDLGVRRLVAELRLRPVADQQARLEVVGGEGRIGRVDRIQRRVERDHQDARVARLLHGGTMAAVSDGTIRMPLAPSAMQVSIAATWLSLSPSTLPA